MPRIRLTCAAIATFIAAVAMPVVVAAPAAADDAVACRGAATSVLRDDGPQMETVQLRTYHIEAKPLTKSFAIGKTAKVAVTVTRPAEEDPLGNGLPVPQVSEAPVPDANVGIGVTLGDVFFPGFARTDEMGKATVSIKLKSYAAPGKANATVYAYTTTVNTTCLRVEENGYREYPTMFSVTR
jgi:hypothetical protein